MTPQAPTTREVDDADLDVPKAINDATRTAELEERKDL